LIRTTLIGASLGFGESAGASGVAGAVGVAGVGFGVSVGAAGTEGVLVGEAGTLGLGWPPTAAEHAERMMATRPMATRRGEAVEWSIWNPHECCS
jgi:hypothetical protein